MSEIQSTYYHSPVGLLKISGTEDYITEIIFNDKVQRLDVRKKFITHVDTMSGAIDPVLQWTKKENLNCPFINRGSSFQQGVWAELMAIPFGKTISYIELARRIGDTKATRAVASANGKNNVCIIVPCHRVIGANKELVGYSGRALAKEMAFGARNESSVWSADSSS